MSYGTFVHIDRAERLRRLPSSIEAEQRRMAASREAREWVRHAGMLDERGEPCSFAVQQALRLRCRHGRGNVTKAMVREAWQRRLAQLESRQVAA